MACKGKVAVCEDPKEGLEQGHYIGLFQDLNNAQQAALLSSSSFNHGDPDLSFCDVLATGIETESDQPSNVDVEEFTDLMLFPDLVGVLEDLPVFQDFPVDHEGGVDGTLFKPREVISSVASVTDGNGETSPAESDASVEHFFNTFTDLTRFLDNFENAGPSDLNDLATSIAGSNEPFDNDAEPSGTATMTTPPTPVGSETMSNEENGARRTAPPMTDSEAPPTKRARTSRTKDCANSSKQRYRHRRDKNNVASQRSRASRKQREKDMAVQAKELEAENARLKIRIDELSVIAEEARRCLVTALSQK